jgi:hypothetical protein
MSNKRTWWLLEAFWILSKPGWLGQVLDLNLFFVPQVVQPYRRDKIITGQAWTKESRQCFYFYKILGHPDLHCWLPWAPNSASTPVFNPLIGLLPQWISWFEVFLIWWRKKWHAYKELERAINWKRKQVCAGYCKILTSLYKTAGWGV